MRQARFVEIAARFEIDQNGLSQAVDPWVQGEPKFIHIHGYLCSCAVIVFFCETPVSG